MVYGFNSIKYKMNNISINDDFLNKNSDLKNYFYLNLSTSEQDETLILPHEEFVKIVNNKYSNFIRKQKIDNNKSSKNFFQKIYNIFKK